LKETAKIWDYALFTNLETSQFYVSQNPSFKNIWGSHVLNYFLMDIQAGTMDSVSSLINQRTVAQLISVEKEKIHLKKITGSNSRLQYLIVGILLLLSMLLVLAIFFTRMEARTIELAILRALGFSKKEITIVLLSEAFWIGATAVVLSIIIETLISPLALATIDHHGVLNMTAIIYLKIHLGIGITTLIAISLASLPPLLRLYRQDVHSILRNIN